MEPKTTAIKAIKQEVRLQEWSVQIRAQQASGQTVKQWCAQNAVNPKTYYYHLKTVRKQYLESAPSIVPLTAPQTSTSLMLKLECHLSAHTQALTQYYDFSFKI